MKLTRIRSLGRYLNKATGQKLNIKKGTRVGRGTDHYFYLYMGNRIWVTDSEFHSPNFEKTEP